MLPFHRCKHAYRAVGVGKPDTWCFTEFYGWLGTGITDKNDVEIFEGDIVKHVIPPGYVQDDNLYVVFYCRGSYLLINKQDWARREHCGATPLNWVSSASIEVIGHISEDES